MLTIYDTVNIKSRMIFCYLDKPWQLLIVVDLLLLLLVNHSIQDVGLSNEAATLSHFVLPGALNVERLDSSDDRLELPVGGLLRYGYNGRIGGPHIIGTAFSIFSGNIDPRYLKF